VSELRKDAVTGRWVIIATDRARRPNQYVRTVEERKGGFCPFCPGNEASTPPEVLSYRPPETLPNTEGWWIRVVPNKFPALEPDGELVRAGEGIYDRMTGIGRHEVLIESPSHEHTYADLPVDQIQEILWALRDRTVDLRKDRRMRYMMIFKNWGREAGASIEHPHSQIIALPVVPKRVQEELTGASKYFDFRERCVFCDMIHQELESKVRTVCENDTFVSFMPFAARFPFETWIVPKEHTAFFSDIQKNEVADLSSLLKQTFSLLKRALNDPPYNFVIHTTPFENAGDTVFYHWHIEIIPKLTMVAGFEWGTGFYINPTPPEAAAEHLRKLAEKDTVEQPASQVVVATT
jgi:UDPglucose--hexose-1-phosphate uridylyltransferase